MSTKTDLALSMYHDASGQAKRMSPVSLTRGSVGYFDVAQHTTYTFLVRTILHSTFDRQIQAYFIILIQTQIQILTH